MSLFQHLIKCEKFFLIDYMWIMCKTMVKTVNLNFTRQFFLMISWMTKLK